MIGGRTSKARKRRTGGRSQLFKNFLYVNESTYEPTPSNHPHLILGLTSPYGVRSSINQYVNQKTKRSTMKTTIRLAITGFAMLPDGGAAILTRPSKENPSPNGVHQLKPGQVQRIAQRTLGFNSPAALKHAIAASGGQAVLTIDKEEIKAGDAWENKLTGEKGTYGEKNGGKDWTKYSNHEIELGLSATMKLMEITATAAINAGALALVAAAPVMKQPALGIPGDVATSGEVQP